MQIFRNIPKNWIVFNEKCTQTISVLIPLGLIVAASATDAAIYKEMFWSGMTKLIILNEEIKNVWFKMYNYFENMVEENIQKKWMKQEIISLKK